MSGFITNLVTRSLGTAAVVRPRLPSFFEPATQYALSVAQTSITWDPATRNEDRLETLREAAFEEADRVAPAGERPPSASRGRSEGSARRGLPPQVVHPFPGNEPTRGEAIRRPIAVSAPPFEGMPREGAAAVLPALGHAASAQKNNERSGWLSTGYSKSALDERGSERVAISGAARRKLPVRDLVGLAALDRSTGQPPASEMSRVQLRTTKGDPEQASSDLPESQTDGARRSFEKPEARAKSMPIGTASSRMRDFTSRAAVAIEPPGTRRFEFARQIAPPHLASPPEPMVQVTIGRVEVRAVSSQVSKPKQRSASPVMNLNDYLAQHSKRGGA